jgi:hypothetical protein
VSENLWSHCSTPAAHSSSCECGQTLAAVLSCDRRCLSVTGAPSLTACLRINAILPCDAPSGATICASAPNRVAPALAMCPCGTTSSNACVLVGPRACLNPACSSLQVQVAVGRGFRVSHARVTENCRKRQPRARVHPHGGTPVPPVRQPETAPSGSGRPLKQPDSVKHPIVAQRQTLEMTQDHT